MTAPMKMDELVATYLALRQKKEEIEDRCAQEVAPIRATLDKMEAVFLKLFDEAGINSSKTDEGTVYTYTSVSATVGDWDATLRYILENGAYEMLERRVNKTAVKQFKEAHNDIPPGVNWSETRSIGVRTPRAKL